MTADTPAPERVDWRKLADTRLDAINPDLAAQLARRLVDNSRAETVPVARFGSSI